MTPAASGTMGNIQRPGERLKQVRLQQGHSLKDISRELNIPERQLALLEADDYKALPEPAFVKGYLRNYGRYLGLEVPQLVSRFEELYTSDTGLPSNHALENSPLKPLGRLEAKRGRRWMRLLWWLLLAGLLLGLAYAVWLYRAAVPAEHLATDESDTSSAMDAVTSTTTASSPAISHTVPASGVLSHTEAVGTGVLNTPAAVPTTSLTPAAQDNLSLVLSGPVTVHISDAQGKTLLEGAQESGKTLTVTGVSPFGIRLSPAANVQLRFNGERVNLPTFTRPDGAADFRLSR